MHKYIISNQAIEDLGYIWDYTSKVWSANQADTYYRAIVSGFDVICSNPTLFGTDYGIIMDGLKGFKIKKHIIFYFIQPSSEVFIVRILHESMDLSHYLNSVSDPS